MVCKVCPSLCLTLSANKTLYRCTAIPTNLDGDLSPIPRTHEHTEALREAYLDDFKGLWDGYGVVGELEVSLR
jgi:hypothetical protein